MRLSWVELAALLSTKIKNDDYRHLAPLLENALFLNESYDTKSYRVDTNTYFDNVNSWVNELYDLISNAATDEQIMDKAQALVESINNIIWRDIKPLMFKQAWIIERMKAAGYKITGLGECYGLSNMAVQAFLVNDMDTFNKRLQIIYDMPVDYFENNFEKLRKEKQACLDKNEDQKASAVNATMVDIHAFFDGVVLHQRPNIYLHDENNQPISKRQNSKITTPITQSIALERNNTTPTVIDSFSGSYTKKDLKNYLDLLVNEVGKDYPFALNLISNAHAMTLLYDAQTKHWILIDPNHLPAQEYVQTQLLAEALVYDFEAVLSPAVNKTGVLVMGAQIITAEKNKQSFQAQVEALKCNPQWNTLQSQRKEFRDCLGLTSETLYKIFYDESQDELQWTESMMLDLALQSGQSDIIIEYAKNNSIDIFVNKSDYDVCKLLLILPRTQQQQMLDKLTNKRKANVISFGNPDNMPMLTQMLSEEEQLAVFHQMSSLYRGDYIRALSGPQLKSLFEQLSLEDKTESILKLETSDKLKLFQSFTEKEQTFVFLNMYPEEQIFYLGGLEREQTTFLWSQLEEKEKMEIMRSHHAAELLTFIQLFPEQEQLAFFHGFPVEGQVKFLIKLVSLSLTDQKDFYLGSLSIEQKFKLLVLDGLGFNPYARQNLLSHAFFELLSWGDQLALFLQLSSKEKNSLLCRLEEEYGLTQLRQSLQDELTLDEKEEIVSLSDSSIIKSVLLNGLRPEERLAIFLKQTPVLQIKTLDVLEKKGCIEDVHALLDKLTLEQKSNMITHQLDDRSVFGQSMLNIFKTMSESQIIEVLEAQNAKSELKYSFFWSDYRFLHEFLDQLSIAARFQLIKNEISIPLPDLKVILQDKIAEEIALRTSNRSAFDQIKKEIAKADATNHLFELISELEDLLESKPSAELVDLDMTSLVRDDELPDVQTRKPMSLHQILKSIGLDQETLTAASLKKVWLKIHPDKVKLTSDNFQEAKTSINTLKVFLSMDSLAAYYLNTDIQGVVNDQLCGITLEDERYLVEKAITTMKNYSGKTKINAELMDGINKFVEANVISQEKGVQPFSTTLIALSKAASALVHPQERRAFQKEASHYHYKKDQLSFRNEMQKLSKNERNPGEEFPMGGNELRKPK